MRLILSVVTTLVLLSSNSSKADNTDANYYVEAGVTRSMLIKPTIGYWWNGMGVRIAGMYLDRDHQEFDLNIGFELGDFESVQQSLNILTSWVVGRDSGANYKYAATGIAYGIKNRGFFFEVGLAIPWRDDLGNLVNDPLVPVGSWGYIHSFK